MKVEVTPKLFAEIRQEMLDDELRGCDPGLRWWRPGVTEVEFVVVPEMVYCMWHKNPCPVCDNDYQKCVALHRPVPSADGLTR